MKKLQIVFGLVLLVIALWFFRPFLDPKVLTITKVIASQNHQAQDFYGKVIDQYGKPVEGATALGTLLWIQGIDIGERREQHTTQTDQNGEFQFTGYHASRLAVAVSKAGYEMDNRGRAYKAPNAENKSSPTQRAMLTIWKLKGPEPIIHTKIEAGIACDGTSRHFDVLTAHRDSGTLIASLIRNPMNIDRSKPFDWTFTLSFEDAGAGFIPITTAYPYDAPADGYRAVSIRMPVDSKMWNVQAGQAYYFFDGKHYGRLTVNIMANYQPPPTHVEFDAFVNPSGSRNLEFDPAKEIKL